MLKVVKRRTRAVNRVGSIFPRGMKQKDIYLFLSLAQEGV